MSGPIISPDLSPVTFGRNAGVSSQTATKAKTVPEFKDGLRLAYLVCLARETHWQCCERLLQVSVCQPAVDILSI